MFQLGSHMSSIQTFIRSISITSTVNMEWLAVSDLHGRPERYRNLFREVSKRDPPAVLMGGDLFPTRENIREFLEEYLFKPLEQLRKEGIRTRFLVILGNDDPKENEPILIEANEKQLIDYIPMQMVRVEDIPVVGYPYVNPSPFLLKDWELYDKDKSIRPGCIPLEEGIRTTPIDLDLIQERTIEGDMLKLNRLSNPKKTVYMFHSPPYGTYLDVLGSRQVQDPHIGSHAIGNFIERFQPPVTLHGHIHESYHVSGRFYERIGSTLSISTCGIEEGLVLVSFDPTGKEDPKREVFN